jgi:hypothetical protein
MKAPSTESFRDKTRNSLKNKGFSLDAQAKNPPSRLQRMQKVRFLSFKGGGWKEGGTFGKNQRRQKDKKTNSSIKNPKIKIDAKISQPQPSVAAAAK